MLSQTKWSLQIWNSLLSKNHPDRKYSFEKGVNCIVGRNGVGKTNLLDAINYLAFGRTALNATEVQSIRHGELTFVVRGSFEEDLIVGFSYENRKGKTLKVNGEEQTKISDHVGKVPLVLTTPDDSDLIREGSEFRRKFFDGTISQLDPDFLKSLMEFNRVLKQRNEHLKSSVNGIVDHRLLDTYDEIFLSLGNKISSRRKSFLDEFIPNFKSSYTALHDDSEVPEIEFQSDVLSDDFEEKFKSSRDKDIIVQRTCLGAQRDRYIFKLDEALIRKMGSQGQQKTFILALRLAEYDRLKTSLEKKPLLMLDDIFDRLDDNRINKLVNLLTDDDRFGQIFITDARKERSKSFFVGQVVNFIELE